MAPIRILADEVANQIAAGEVVERPASVVKELVENAIDASARHVTVELVTGGKKRISVLDDGVAMTKDDVLLAIERHATSKIAAATDLDSIATFGFRGEALPSIASVSKFEIVSRTEDALEATRVVVAGGKMRDVSSVGGPRGTRVTVENLFFNVPGRRKFLKSTTTELSHIIKAVQGLALAHPETGFRLKHNGRRTFDVSPCKTLLDRVAMIFGPEMTQQLVEIGFDEGGYIVNGLAATPALTRADRSGLLFFVNNRLIISPVLNRAISRAYRGLLTVGRFPVCILKVEVPPELVDVNVHPTKREVRFRDEPLVEQMVQKAVRDALAHVPARRPDERDWIYTKPARGRADDSDAGRPAVAVRAAPPPPRPVRPRTKPEKPAARMTATAEDVDLTQTADELLDTDREILSAEQAAAEPEHTKSADTVPQAVFSEVDQIEEVPFQVFNTYLVVPQSDRLLLVDQHALHERLVFEDLREVLSGHMPTLQRLLVPIPVELPPNQAAVLAEKTEFLRSLGVEIESFGQNTFLVTAACHLFSEQKVDDLVRRVAAELSQGDLFRDEQELWESMVALSVAACRSAIKAGQALSVDERRALLAGLRKLTPPYTCPHGRPIVTELTLDQIERSFRRT